MYKIGILGFGKLGEYLYDKIEKDCDCEVAFVWNRSSEVLNQRIRNDLILDDLDNIHKFKIDLIIEVCHPDVIRKYGEKLIKYADIFIGSPTALVDETLRESLIKECLKYKSCLFIPSGAMWGIEDIRRIDGAGKIKKLKITMEKHPQSIKLTDKHYQNIVDNSMSMKLTKIVYEGPVKEICEIAPNNVNTMAAAALTCQKFGFNNVIGCLVANPNNSDSHIVTVELLTTGGLEVTTVRRNPAGLGNVTGQATFDSFWASIKKTIRKYKRRDREAGLNDEENECLFDELIEFC